LLGAAALLLAAALAPARAQAARLALVVGNNRGDARDEPLRYAEADAARMAALFVRLGGVDPGGATLLVGRSAADVRAAFAAAAAALSGAPGDHLFLFYYSGHADRQALHLGAETLPFAELKALALALPVAVRVVMVDACQSGALARMKGGRPGVAFEIDAADHPRGLAILASSRDSEASQESDDLRGSFFTHHLHAGLSGMADRDRDGRVSLGESFEYAAERTLSATAETWAGPQHPTFRYDLTGQADVVLSYPGTPGVGYGRLAFGHAGWYFVRRPRGAIVAEVRGRGGEQIALEEGRYEVERRETGHIDVALAQVVSGALTDVAALPTRELAFGRAVRKGGGIRARAYSVAAEGIMRSPVAALGASSGGALAARVDAAPGSLELRVALARAGRETLVPSETWDVSLAVAALRAWDLRVATLAAGLEAGWSVFHQRTALTTDSTLAQAPSLGPTALAELPLGRRLCARLELALPVYALDTDSTSGHRLGAAASVRVGLGAGGYF
jgi:hypothetical protein